MKGRRAGSSANQGLAQEIGNWKPGPTPTLPPLAQTNQHPPDLCPLHLGLAGPKPTLASPSGGLREVQQSASLREDGILQAQAGAVGAAMLFLVFNKANS